MVGQTLQKRFRYYRCRSAFAGPKIDRCPTVYVRADSLELAVKQQAAMVLADPQRVLAEWERLNSPSVSAEIIATLEHEVRDLQEQRHRLLKLYQLGEIDDAYLQRESATLHQRIVEAEGRFPSEDVRRPERPSLAKLERMSVEIQRFIESAQGEDLDLLVGSLQLSVRAVKGRGELSGVLPEYAPSNGDADICSMVINHGL